METPDYIALNRACWNERTAHHLGSEFYDLEGFKKGKSSLKAIELELLGDVRGKKILHLQCHFGQDTLSLARMGAEVTGVDLSDKAIETARALTQELGLEARFICCNVYDLPQHLNEQFDLVFTSYGTIGWLPDLDQWAGILQQFLRPGGQFVFVEFHPFVWMYDNDFKTVTYSYFKAAPIVETETGTYADTQAPIQTHSVGWNHSLGEVIGSLLKQGLQIRDFQEYDYSPYNCFPHTEKVGEDNYRLLPFENKVPLVYSILALKPIVEL